MRLADFSPEEVVNWIERFDKDDKLLIKTLEKALDEVPLIEYWVRTHAAGRQNNAPEEFLYRIKDLINLLLALYSIENKQMN